MAEHLAEPGSESSTILSTTHLTIRGTTFEFLKHPLLSPFHRDRLQFSVSLASQRSRLQVRHAQDPLRPLHSLVQGLPNARDGVVLDLINDGASARFRADSEDVQASLSIHPSRLKFVSAAAELITATVHSWFIVSRAIEAAVIDAQYTPPWIYRHLICQIVQQAQRDGVTTDPVFLSRPTVASMTARSDVAWRSLGHFRHRYRRLSPASKSAIQAELAQPTEQPESEQFRLLASHLQEWYSWDLDRPSILASTVFQQVFPRETAKLHRESPAGLAPLSTTQLQFSWDTLVKVQLAVDQLETDFFEDGIINNNLKLSPSLVLIAYGPGMRSDDVQAKSRITIGALQVTLNPTFLRLVRHVARVRQVFEAKLAPLRARPPKRKPAIDPELQLPAPLPRYPRPANLPIFVTLLCQGAHFRAYAHGIWLQTTVSKLQGTIDPTLHLEPPTPILSLQGSALLACDRFNIRANTESDQHRQDTFAHTQASAANETGTLFTMAFEQAYSHASLHSPEHGPVHVALYGAITSSEVRFPRSLLSLSHFVESWREGSLPQSKADFNELRRDFERDRVAGLSTAPPQKALAPVYPSNISFSFHLAFPGTVIRIRVSKQMWLALTISDMLLHGQASVKAGNFDSGKGGLSVRQSRVRFAPVSNTATSTFSEKQIILPAIHSSLHAAAGHSVALIGIGRVDFVVTMAFLDTILTGLSLIGHDLDGLLHLITKLSKQSDRTSISAQRKGVFPLLANWQAQLAVRGLNVGLRGPSATQYVSADLVQARVARQTSGQTGALAWQATIVNLALSLVQETNFNIAGPRLSKHESVFDRSYRLAFFLLDVDASNKNIQLDQLSAVRDVEGADHLHVEVKKVHAVMQAAAVEALDDLIDHGESCFWVHMSGASDLRCSAG